MIRPSKRRVWLGTLIGSEGENDGIGKIGGGGNLSTILLGEGETLLSSKAGRVGSRKFLLTGAASLALEKQQGKQYLHI